MHGHSFTGNPIVCAAACASLDLFEQETTWKSIETICELNSQFKEQIKNNKNIKEIRLCGTILAIELQTGEGNTYFSSIRDVAYNFFLSKGLLIRPLGNVIFINPPYSITTEELNKIYQEITNFLCII